MAAGKSQREQLATGALAFPLAGETFAALRGSDRAALLNNLCTNNIKKLAVGHGCEAFVTNIQGKVLAHVDVQAQADQLLLHSVPEQAAKILAHLDRYIIREDVQLEDLTDASALIYLAGAAATQFLTSLGAAELPAERLAFVSDAIDGCDATITRADWTLVEGFRIDCQASHSGQVLQALAAAGAEVGEADAFDLARIEAGTPRYGRDITDENLAQEVDRNAQAIDFNKGCYLGQEPIARIDALGHVNRTLCRLRIDASDPPPAGMELFADEKPAGKITSAAFSPGEQTVFALGYVRRGHNAPDARLQSEAGEVRIVGNA